MHVDVSTPFLRDLFNTSQLSHLLHITLHQILKPSRRAVHTLLMYVSEARVSADEKQERKGCVIMVVCCEDSRKATESRMEGGLIHENLLLILSCNYRDIIFVDMKLSEYEEARGRLFYTLV